MFAQLVCCHTYRERELLACLFCFCFGQGPLHSRLWALAPGVPLHLPWLLSSHFLVLPCLCPLQRQPIITSLVFICDMDYSSFDIISFQRCFHLRKIKCIQHISLVYIFAALRISYPFCWGPWLFLRTLWVGELRKIRSEASSLSCFSGQGCMEWMWQRSGTPGCWDTKKDLDLAYRVQGDGWRTGSKTNAP